MARRMKTAQQAGDRYGTGVAGAGSRYTEGIQNAGSWTEGALGAAQRRNAGLQAAIASGAIDRGIQNLGDAQWKTKTLAKGPTAYTQSVNAAKPAYVAGMQQAMQYQAAAQQATAGMDTTTLEGRIAKSAAWQRAVAEAKRQAKGG